MGGQWSVCNDNWQCCRYCMRKNRRQWLAWCSASTVANHAGTVAAVVDVGAELDHAHERLAAAAAAAELCRRRHDAAA
jgi:hypothetical protein